MRTSREIISAMPKDVYDAGFERRIYYVSTDVEDGVEWSIAGGIARFKEDPSVYAVIGMASAPFDLERIQEWLDDKSFVKVDPPYEVPEDFSYIHIHKEKGIFASRWLQGDSKQTRDWIADWPKESLAMRLHEREECHKRIREWHLKNKLKI